jgi:hypothetical protein
MINLSRASAHVVAITTEFNNEILLSSPESGQKYMFGKTDRRLAEHIFCSVLYAL